MPLTNLFQACLEILEDSFKVGESRDFFFPKLVKRLRIGSGSDACEVLTTETGIAALELKAITLAPLHSLAIRFH